MGRYVRLLGPVRVERDGRCVHLSAQARAVLAILALRHGTPVSPDELSEVLWTAPPRSARVQIQGLISILRRALGTGEARPDSPIVTESASYTLRLQPPEFDLHRFGHAVAEGDRLRHAGQPATALGWYTQALELWTGTPCADVDRPAVRELAEPLVEAYADALEDWARLALADGRPAKVVARLQPAVGRHPYRERLRGLLMTALDRAGRSAEALTVYERGRQSLADELGVEPSPQLQELYRTLLNGGTPALTGPTAGERR